MLFDKKGSVKLITPEYPITIKNFNREEKVCNNKDELWKHLVDDTNENIPIITRIMPVHPEHFIHFEILQIISQFVRYKNYGINFIYPSWDDVPNGVQIAFDYISAQVAENEKKQMEKNSGKNKVTKPTDAVNELNSTAKRRS